ncbi:hypothetical protein ANME2D_00990 [Candidatus Methanoperedens nitroreducens]|uniref:Uncharacterized protein n=1 Tax=Candidatus Methanoperedens nitratireducens TaxID=1392998 RepID=A0A062V093_9EURY|nr:hypothetical protein ANME2D_00990 [Candidatus Methanoperedens nitroreducens]
MDKINSLPAKKVIKALEKIGNDAKITREEWLELIKTV